MLGETNSVFGNLVSIAIWEKADDRRYIDEPKLYKYKREGLVQPDYKDRLREQFTVDEGGKIRLGPDLLQQIDNEIPVAAVWLQAAIDTGRLEDTKFANKDLGEIIDELDSENIKELIKASWQDWEQYEEILDEAEKRMGNVDVPVESMYFVAPGKDAEAWMKVIARSEHKPAGILLYDDKKVRLENFASIHRGDHTELTRELQTAVSPDNQDYIEYSKVIGV